MTKVPFVFEHTTKNSPLEGVTITAGAQAAVRQPSTPASGRGEALEGGASCAIPPPFQRREVGVRTSHTTAAERLSSMSNIPANISSLMARCTREGHHSFFRLKLVTSGAPTACLINIGGHLEKALHSDTFRATKTHRRAAETNLQHGTRTGRDWPVYEY